MLTMAPQNIGIHLLCLCLALCRSSMAFNLKNSFGATGKTSIEKPSISIQKARLLEAVSGTANGKTASPQQQAEILRLVRDLETSFPPSPQLLSDPKLAKRLLDGVWYLQYTSPSDLAEGDQFPDVWKPEFATEGTSNIETRKFNAKGSVSALGVPVDTSRRVVQQVIDVDNAIVRNVVELEWGEARASGPFRQSPNIDNRAIVSFDEASISFTGGPSINLGFVFSIVSFLSGSTDRGWLEVTFVDEDLRIGRGNKGTMFVLTRELDSVTP